MSQKIHYPIFSKPNSESATLFQALATALTDTYAAVGSEIDCQGHTTGYLHLYWTKGDESSVQIKAEFYLLLQELLLKKYKQLLLIQWSRYGKNKRLHIFYRF